MRVNFLSITLMSLLASIPVHAEMPGSFRLFSPKPSTQSVEVKTCVLNASAAPECQLQGTLTHKQVADLTRSVYWRATGRDLAAGGLIVVAATGGALVGYYMAAGFITGLVTGAAGTSGGSVAGALSIFTWMGASFGAAGAGGALTAGAVGIAGYVMQYPQTTENLWQIQARLEQSLETNQPIILGTTDPELSALLDRELLAAGMVQVPAPAVSNLP